MPLVVDPAHFVTLDRQDEVSRIGVEASVLVPDQYTNTPADVAVRLDVHGEYVGGNGWGFYGSLPAGYANNISWGIGVGDAELGLLYVAHAADWLTLVPHASIVLDTGPTSGHSVDALRVAFPSRETDVFEGSRGGNGFRGGISPLVRSGNVFARLDLDVWKNQAGTIVQVNAGVGAIFGRVALMAESSNYSYTPDIFIIDSAALAVRWDDGRVAPYGALVFGLDQSARAEMDEAITAGAEIAL
jgi:hypothetical protein